VISTKTTVRNRVGFHIAAASQVVETSMKFKAKITLAKGKKKRNALSVLDLLLLDAPQGTELTIEADGEDEREAMAALLQLFDANFGEK
jgi:phosphocarrier protein HPr